MVGRFASAGSRRFHVSTREFDKVFARRAKSALAQLPPLFVVHVKLLADFALLADWYWPGHLPIMTPTTSIDPARFFSFRVIICSMTDAEKLAHYERIIEIVRDRLALEKYYAEKGEDWETIQFARCDAYKNIVDAVFGAEVLHDLENRRTLSRIVRGG
jgi:hypothetical protein